MSIESVGNFNKMLENFKTEDWQKSTKIDSSTLPKFNELGQISTGDNKSFSEVLASSLAEVNTMQVEANKAVEKLASGQTKNISETMLAVEQAEIAFKTMNQVRMKVIEAYKEIMRMQM